MLPTDELFSDGKLLPLHLYLSSLKPFTPSTIIVGTGTGTGTTESPASPPITSATKPVEPFLFSHKAPRCSSRWRELLGIKKKQPLSQNTISDQHKTMSWSSSSSTKSIKQFLNNRASKTTSSS
ncbi:hypothetical protein RIF29_00278 [Crotalaria pallida]|uniref:Uncharacterized protein n=1 Tax=Crotalaria pallida TaxID=3830 RepID=A0AAN9P6Y2_CROPI